MYFHPRRSECDVYLIPSRMASLYANKFSRALVLNKTSLMWH